MYIEVKNIKESQSLEVLLNESQSLVFYNGYTFKYFEKDGIPYIGIKIVDDYIIFKWDVPAQITHEMFCSQEFGKEKFFAEHFKQFCSGNGYFRN